MSRRWSESVKTLLSLGLLIGVLVAGLLFTARSAHAAEFTVNSTGDTSESSKAKRIEKPVIGGG